MGRERGLFIEKGREMLLGYNSLESESDWTGHDERNMLKVGRYPRVAKTKKAV